MFQVQINLLSAVSSDLHDSRVEVWVTPLLASSIGGSTSLSAQAAPQLRPFF